MNYTRTETYIELRWKMIVQDPDCVKAMEFFVDGEKEKDIWGKDKENTRIDKSGEFSLKVEVYFLSHRQSGSSCYGTSPGWECKCFEAKKRINVDNCDY